jgi:hypothetical protein
MLDIVLAPAFGVSSNPYLQEFDRLRRELDAQPAASGALPHSGRGFSTAERRMWCMRRYSFGVPDEAALDAIARRAPVLELGAGTGYWTYLLRARGVDCLAFDVAPPDRSVNPHQFRPLTWTYVEQGGIETLARYGQDRSLLLVWPTWRDPFADQALAGYPGPTVIYVGEPRGGHTADDAFFDRLSQDWRVVEHVQVPRWPGTRDSLSVFERRTAIERRSYSRSMSPGTCWPPGDPAVS